MGPPRTFMGGMGMSTNELTAALLHFIDRERGYSF